MELGADMLSNHGINSLQIMISPTVMKSPSITGPLIKYGKLSSAGERIGTTRFSLCALISSIIDLSNAVFGFISVQFGPIFLF